jgi:transcriptional regulator with XRE-family HTH domain
VKKKGPGKYLKNDPFLKKVGDNIRTYRKAKGLTIEQFANESGLDYSQLSRMELGKVGFNIIYLPKVAEALDIPIELLIK